MAISDSCTQPIFESQPGTAHSINDPEILVHSHQSLPPPPFCYPGSDSTFPGMLFMTLYDEEEYIEFQEERVKLEPDCRHRLESGPLPRTVYHVMRLFDSLLGFHKGTLDLSGRHPLRYYGLQTQWNRFLGSLLALETEGPFLPKFTSPGLTNTPIVVDTDRWARFQTKWRLPEAITQSQLSSCTQRVLRELRHNPIPHFQMIGLLDLPTEVLHHIVGLSDIPQAKVLSTTCQALKLLSQQRIFKTWHMCLNVPVYIPPADLERTDIDIPAMAVASRRRLEDKAKFLLDHPHLAAHIQKLYLTDEWWMNKRVQPKDINDNPYTLSAEFYESVHELYGIALKCATNLTTLTLYNLELSKVMIRRLADIPTLQNLDLHLSRVTRWVRRKLLAGRFDTFLPAISNLKISLDTSFTETHSQWYSLLLCPNIRTIALTQYGIEPFHFPPDPAFWPTVHLEHLERVSVDNVDYLFTRAFTHAVARKQMLARTAESGPYDVGGPHLTHFKLHVDRCIPDAKILSLLAPIRRMPLQVLVLEGIEQADFMIFEVISEWFGRDLIALTLVRRQGESQHENRRAVWPYTSGEYAQMCFGRHRLSKLRHFCWNFWTEYWDATPSVLTLFETDWSRNVATLTDNAVAIPDAPPSSSSSLTDDAPSHSFPPSAIEDSPYFLDSHWLALPFAAYSKTLETFSLMDRSVDMVCHISHVPRPGGGPGRILLRPRYYPNSGNGTETGVTQWNTPPGMSGGGAGWPGLPPLIPESE